MLKYLTILTFTFLSTTVSSVSHQTSNHQGYKQIKHRQNLPLTTTLTLAQENPFPGKPRFKVGHSPSSPVSSCEDNDDCKGA